jgi:hypothetical protein
MAAPSNRPRKIGPSRIYHWGDPARQEDIEYTIDEIIRRLREDPRETKANVRTAVTSAAITMMAAGANRPSNRRSNSPKVFQPGTARKRIADLRALADKLYVELQSIPPQEDLKHNKRDFLNTLKRISAIEYNASRGDPVRDLSAEIAYQLISEFSRAEPVSTDNSLFREVTDNLYHIARPPDPDKPATLRRACDKVLNRHRQAAP